MQQDTHNTQVQIQAYNLVDFVLAVQDHAAKGYKMNPEKNEECCQMLGPGLFICGMTRQLDVTDVEVERFTDKVPAQTETQVEDTLSDLAVDNLEHNLPSQSSGEESLCGTSLDGVEDKVATAEATQPEQDEPTLDDKQAEVQKLKAKKAAK